MTRRLTTIVVATLQHRRLIVLTLTLVILPHHHFEMSPSLYNFQLSSRYIPVPCVEDIELLKECGIDSSFVTAEHLCANTIKRCLSI